MANDPEFAKEIESLGGKVYVFDEYFKGYNYRKFAGQWKKFFRKHRTKDRQLLQAEHIPYSSIDKDETD